MPVEEGRCGCKHITESPEALTRERSPESLEREWTFVTLNTTFGKNKENLIGIQGKRVSRGRTMYKKSHFGNAAVNYLRKRFHKGGL